MEEILGVPKVPWFLKNFGGWRDVHLLGLGVGGEEPCNEGAEVLLLHLPPEPEHRVSNVEWAITCTVRNGQGQGECRIADNMFEWVHRSVLLVAAKV